MKISGKFWPKIATCPKMPNKLYFSIPDLQEIVDHYILSPAVFCVLRLLMKCDEEYFFLYI